MGRDDGGWTGLWEMEREGRSGYDMDEGNRLVY